MLVLLILGGDFGSSSFKLRKYLLFWPLFLRGS